ncbi:unnamed protein product, partial [Dovyalis caffra]
MDEQINSQQTRRSSKQGLPLRRIGLPGKMKDDTSQKAGDNASRKVGAKDLRASLDDKKTNTKNRGREFAINNSRKSLPVLKRVSRADASNAKPTLKTEINQKTSRSKCISSSNKFKSIATVSSKEKEPVASCPENMPFVVVNGVTEGEPSSDSNKESGADHKSELLKEHGEVIEQEKLPSIDDTFNQLEVAEYVDEIYEYYWVLE